VTGAPVFGPDLREEVSYQHKRIQYSWQYQKAHVESSVAEFDFNRELCTDFTAPAVSQITLQSNPCNRSMGSQLVRQFFAYEACWCPGVDRGQLVWRAAPFEPCLPLCG